MSNEGEQPETTKDQQEPTVEAQLSLEDELQAFIEVQRRQLERKPKKTRDELFLLAALVLAEYGGWLRKHKQELEQAKEAKKGQTE
jgi:hypothetical protein